MESVSVQVVATTKLPELNPGEFELWKMRIEQYFLTYCKNGKLERVIGVVMTYMPNALGDMTVTLKDPSGTIGGLIHYKVFQ
ncbi:reverse transcriptase domain-containing protein [Tanacetum coccineum]